MSVSDVIMSDIYILPENIISCDGCLDHNNANNQDLYSILIKNI